MVQFMPYPYALRPGLVNYVLISLFTLSLTACGGGGAEAPADNPTPTASATTPSQMKAAGPDFTITVTGSGFVSDSVVRWNGADRTTTFVSSTEVTATVTAADITAPGTAPVTVFNPTPGGGLSAEVMFTITNPVPVAGTLTADNATTGGPEFMVTVTGSQFVDGATVQWNGADRVTTFVSAGELQATIPATDIALGGTAEVTVANPAPGGGTSGPMTFTINNPAPTTSGLLPSAIPEMQLADFSVTINGTNFVPNSVARWNGTDLATTFVNASEVSAVVPFAFTAAPGVFNIDVFNPMPVGGLSGAQAFSVSDTAPTTSSVFPSSGLLGAAVTITVTGTNFNNVSVVQWRGPGMVNDVDLTTRFNLGTELEADVPAALINAAGAATVTVRRPGAGISNGQTYTINNPVPATTSLSPSSTTFDPGPFTITVAGSNFVNGSVVRWNGADRATAFTSSSILTVTLLAGDIATIGTRPVTVFNPAPGGGTSNPQDFNVNNPVPTINAMNGLNPAMALAGDGPIMLTVNGTNFATNAAVEWDGVALTTNRVSADQLTATVPIANLANADTVTVTVVNPAPGGGTSNGENFTINNPVPTTATLNPNSVVFGGADLPIMVTGTNFVGTSVVRWNGVNLATTFNSDTQLMATIPAANTAAITNANVDVFNPLPGGGDSNDQVFSVVNPVGTIANLNPDNVVFGSAAFTLEVNGQNFIDGAVVTWNGVNRTTTFDNDTRVTVDIPATDVAAAGTAQVRIVNPAPGGGPSAPVTFTINNPQPTVTSVAPIEAIVGSGAFTLTVNGTNFIDGALVRWNNADRVTTFVSATQLTAAILATDIDTTGTANITVRNPAPAVGDSDPPVVYPINNPTPAITALDIRDVPVDTTGTGTATIQITGTGFINQSEVRIDGNGPPAVTTAFVDATTLTATLASTEIGAARVAALTVVNPPPGGQFSTPETFFVLDPTDEYFYDDFNRPDGALNNDNGWADKTPDQQPWVITSNTVTGPAGGPSGLTFLDKIVSRPAETPRTDVIVSMEFTRLPAPVFNPPAEPGPGDGRFAQVHARIDPATVDPAAVGQLSSYIFFIDDFTIPTPGARAIIAIQPNVQDTGDCYIAEVPFATPLVTGNRYRLRFSVTGPGTAVVLTGWVDELVDGAWVELATGSVTHTPTSPTAATTGLFCGSIIPPATEPEMPPPIGAAGLTGFAKWRDATETLDNFYWITP